MLLHKKVPSQKWGLLPIENKIPVLIHAHDELTACTLARTYGIELVLPLRRDLRLGKRVEVIIASNEIALSYHYVSGISIQNQIQGRICAVIPSEHGVLVQIDCGDIWLASITLRAYRTMNLQEGESIYCLAKTHAFSYGKRLARAWSTR